MTVNRARPWDGYLCARNFTQVRGTQALGRAALLSYLRCAKTCIQEGSPAMPPRTRPQLPQVGEDGLPTSVADWIQEAVSTLDQLRWRVSEADYQMRNPNAIIDTLQRKYEKDVAPLLGDSQKRRKPRIPPLRRADAVAADAIDATSQKVKNNHS